MRLTYNNVYDLAGFQKIDHKMPTREESKAFLKPQYFKTYYCVLELKNDHYSVRDCGFMSKESKWYKKGYYVIPCYLSAHKWLCGDKVVLHNRLFCYMFGELRDYEPHDVPKEKWYIARDFKPYFGLCNDTGILDGYIENYELYDDVNEAIERAKELDKLLNVKEKHDKVSNSLKYAEYAQDQLEMRLRSRELMPTTHRKKLMRELALTTYEKREKQIDKLEAQEEKLRNEMKKITPYNKWQNTQL